MNRTHLSISLVPLTLVTLAAVACGSAPGTEDSTADTTQAVVADGKTTDPCPSSLPRSGSSCTAAQANVLCSWGDDPRFGCREEARCTNGAWENLTYACPSKEPSCPARAPTAPDGGVNVCTDAQLGLTCVYGDTAYTCTPCNGTLCFATQNEWWTQTLATGCPTKVPNFGQACSSNGTYCNYNVCADDQQVDWVFGASVKCESGFWTAYADIICL